MFLNVCHCSEPGTDICLCWARVNNMEASLTVHATPALSVSSTKCLEYSGVTKVRIPQQFHVSASSGGTAYAGIPLAICRPVDARARIGTHLVRSVCSQVVQSIVGLDILLYRFSDLAHNWVLHVESAYHWLTRQLK